MGYLEGLREKFRAYRSAVDDADFVEISKAQGPLAAVISSGPKSPLASPSASPIASPLASASASASASTSTSPSLYFGDLPPKYQGVLLDLLSERERQHALDFNAVANDESRPSSRPHTADRDDDDSPRHDERSMFKSDELAIVNELLDGVIDDKIAETVAEGACEEVCDKMCSESEATPLPKTLGVVVSGVYGKTSVCTKIADDLGSYGVKGVCLLTYPHIFSLRERIVYDGKDISMKDLVAVAQLLLFMLQHKKPATFEAAAAEGSLESNQITAGAAEPALRDKGFSFSGLMLSLGILYFHLQPNRKVIVIEGPCDQLCRVPNALPVKVVVCTSLNARTITALQTDPLREAILVVDANLRGTAGGRVVSLRHRAKAAAVADNANAANAWVEETSAYSCEDPVITSSPPEDDHLANVAPKGPHFTAEAASSKLSPSSLRALEGQGYRRGSLQRSPRAVPKLLAKRRRSSTLSASTAISGGGESTRMDDADCVAEKAYARKNEKCGTEQFDYDNSLTAREASNEILKLLNIPLLQLPLDSYQPLGCFQLFSEEERMSAAHKLLKNEDGPKQNAAPGRHLSASALSPLASSARMPPLLIIDMARMRKSLLALVQSVRILSLSRLSFVVCLSLPLQSTIRQFEPLAAGLGPNATFFLLQNHHARMRPVTSFHCLLGGLAATTAGTSAACEDAAAVIELQGKENGSDKTHSVCAHTETRRSQGDARTPSTRHQTPVACQKSDQPLAGGSGADSIEAGGDPQLEVAKGTDLAPLSLKEALKTTANVWACEPFSAVVKHAFQLAARKQSALIFVTAPYTLSSLFQELNYQPPGSRRRRRSSLQTAQASLM